MTLPYPLRYPLALDGRHLSKVHTIFTDTVTAWYSRHHPEGKNGHLDGHPACHWRKHIVPSATDEPEPLQQKEAAEFLPKPKSEFEKKRGTDARSRYIPWYELLRPTFGSEVICPACVGRLRLIALVKKAETISTILTALHMSTGPPKVACAQSSVGEDEEAELSGSMADEEWLD